MPISYTGTRPAPWLARSVYQFVDPNLYASFEIAPMIVSPGDVGTLPVTPRESLVADGTTTRRAPGASYKRDGLGQEGVAYACVGYGYEVPLPKEQIAMYASIMEARQVAAKKIRTKLFTDLEERMEAMIFNTTTWTGTSLYKDWSAAPWDVAGSDAINHIQTSMEKVRVNTGMKANALILSQVQMNNLVFTNTAIKALLSGLAVPTPDAIEMVIKNLFKIDKLIVPGSVLNTAKEGQTAVMADVWADDYAMVARIATSSDPSEPCVARTVAWQAMGAGTDMDLNIYSEPQTKSEVVQGDMYLDEIVVDSSFGFLMKVDV